MRFKTVLAGVGLLCWCHVAALPGVVLRQGGPDKPAGPSTVLGAINHATRATLRLAAAEFPPQLSSDPAESFLALWQLFRWGERLESTHRLADAFLVFRETAGLCEELSTRFPRWSPTVVQFRRKKITEAMARVGDKIMASGGEIPTPDTVAPPKLFYIPEPGEQAPSCTSIDRKPSAASQPAKTAKPDPADVFLELWQSFQKAEKLKAASRFPEALKAYREVKRLVELASTRDSALSPATVTMQRQIDAVIAKMAAKTSE